MLVYLEKKVNFGFIHRLKTCCWALQKHEDNTKNIGVIQSRNLIGRFGDHQRKRLKTIKVCKSPIISPLLSFTRGYNVDTSYNKTAKLNIHELKRGIFCWALESGSMKNRAVKLLALVPFLSFSRHKLL